MIHILEDSTHKMIKIRGQHPKKAVKWVLSMYIYIYLLDVHQPWVHPVPLAFVEKICSSLVGRRSLHVLVVELAYPNIYPSDCKDQYLYLNGFERSHFGTVDGSEIGDHHLGCIKPCI